MKRILLEIALFLLVVSVASAKEVTSKTIGVISDLQNQPLQLTVKSDKQASEEKEWTPFSKIEVKDGLVRLQFPTEGTKWVMSINESGKRISQYGETLELKFGDKLELVEKHTRIIVIPIRKGDEYLLKIDYAFDKRSFGGALENKVYYIPIKTVETLQVESLQLTIKSDKQVYEVGEEIWIEGFIKNNKDTDWRIGEFIPADALTNFSIEIINQQNEKALINPVIGEDARKMKEAWLVKPSVIKPGQTVKAFRINLSDFLVCLLDKDNSRSYICNYHIFDFIKKGNYAISWKMSSLRAYINGTSNVINIKVLEKKSAPR